MPSRWNFPLLAAPKKDFQGNKMDVHICQDLQGLNLLLQDDSHGIPKIQDLFDYLKGFQVANPGPI